MSLTQKSAAPHKQEYTTSLFHINTFFVSRSAAEVGGYVSMFLYGIKTLKSPRIPPLKACNTSQEHPSSNCQTSIKTYLSQPSTHPLTKMESKYRTKRASMGFARLMGAWRTSCGLGLQSSSRVVYILGHGSSRPEIWFDKN
jgi:hypothetical protein